MTALPPTLTVNPDGGTLLEREAARVIRNAVSDFEREKVSLSSIEHLLRRLDNLADILDRSDVAPQSLRHDARLRAAASGEWTAVRRQA